MPLSGYTRLGGHHTDTAGLRNILAYYGVIASHTKETPSEALLLGLGGGIGGGYFVFQYGPNSTFWIGTRGIWYKVSGEFQTRILTRLGGKPEIKETHSRAKAAKNLDESLAAGDPVVTWVNEAAQSYLTATPAYGAYYYYTVVVCGYEPAQGTYEIDDRAPSAWRMSGADLAATRASIPSQKNRTLTIRPPKKLADLKKAIRAGITDCVTDMLKPRMQNFGLPAIGKWAGLVNNPKDKKGWPTAFPAGSSLNHALYNTFHLIETSGTGGGAFRSMYAEFLDEAADVLRLSRLKQVSQQYRELAGMWTELAESALPDRVPEFRTLKAEARRRRELIEREGPRAESDIKSMTARPRVPAASFLDAADTAALLEQLEQQLRKIHTAEEAAITALRGLVPRA